MIFILIFHFLPLLLISAKPSYRFPFDGPDESPKTTQIDINNPDHQLLLQTFNLNPDQLEKIRSVRLNSMNSTPKSLENDTFKDIKDFRMENIKSNILNVVRGFAPEKTIHEMAAYPMCTQGNASHWDQDNNITVKFSPSLFEHKDRGLYLDTAVLRLFKINPNDPNSREPTKQNNNCEDLPIDSQIRITVSTIQQARRNKREKKKRICNTIMLNVSHTGWIEIDVKRAISIWEKLERQSRSTNLNINNNTNSNTNLNTKSVMVGALTIEVDDEEGVPLKAGQFFEPPTCLQANAAVPWNFYRIYSWSSADMEKVPRFPRLDLKFFDKGLNQNKHNHHHHHHRNRNLYHRLSISSNCSHSSEIKHHHNNHNNNNNNNNSNKNNSNNEPDDFGNKYLSEIDSGKLDNIEHSFIGTVPPTVDNSLGETSSEIRYHRKRHSHHHSNSVASETTPPTINYKQLREESKSEIM